MDYRTIESSHSSYVATARVAMIDGTPDERHTSPIRRTFLLFVLFDFIAAFIMWAFYARMLKFNSVTEALKYEVVQYDFCSSMFDMVILALWRLIVLELSYGIFQWRKPWAAAVATAGTCAVCLLKIFFFKKFQERDPNTSDIFDYVLVICSFVITWIETWFLDFRVLPKEKVAREIAQISDSPTQPLLGNHRMPASTFAPSERYFSPIGSSEASDDEDLNGEATRDAFDVGKHLRLAEEIFEEGVRLIDDESEWKLGSTREGVGRIFTNKSLRRKIIYKMEALIDAQSDALYEDFVEHAPESPAWNTTLECVKRIQKLNDNTDIVYNVVKELLGGAVSSRDFVLLRRWGTTPDGRKAVASVSVEHPGCPRVREHVRGVNGPGITVLSDVDVDGKGMSDFKWILDSDPKGWLPQRIVDQAMFSAMTDFVASLQRHALSLTPGCVPIPNHLEVDFDGGEQFLSSRSSPVG